VVAVRPVLLILDLHLDRRDSGLCIVRRLPVVVCSVDLLVLREYGGQLR
jgi:hypothetical protein